MALGVGAIKKIRPALFCLMVFGGGALKKNKRRGLSLFFMMAPSPKAIKKNKEMALEMVESVDVWTPSGIAPKVSACMSPERTPLKSPSAQNPNTCACV